MNIDLPSISIITPTYNKQNFMKLALYNFNTFNYPKDKIEWIILDDSDDNTLKDMLPLHTDKRIKYYYYNKDDIKDMYNMFIENYKINKKKYNELTGKEKRIIKKYKLRNEHKTGGNFKGNRLPLGLKRNLCVQYASNNIIVHMDDDDYYYPDSLLYRVRKLSQSIKNDQIECIGCSSIGCFHIKNMVSIVYNPNEKYTLSSKKNNMFNTNLYQEFLEYK